MLTRHRLVPLVLALVVGLAASGAACSRGGGKPKAGTPAATGVAPDCAAIAPLDLVKADLGMELQGPTVEPVPQGSSCTYGARSGGAGVQSVQLKGNVDKAAFGTVRDGFKATHAPVKKITGWGDEAYALAVHLFADQNTFAVRKGKVSVVLTGTADFDHLKKLMKALLAKL